MTDIQKIESAITHIDNDVLNKKECSENCMNEHIELKRWLIELIEFKKRLEDTKVEKGINDEKGLIDG